MRWVAAVAVLGATLFGTTAPPAVADPPSPPPSAETIARVEDYLAREVVRRGLPGLEFTMVQGDQVIALNAVGVADTNRKLTPQTPMLLASLSKNLTATAVMQLVDTHQISLDAPVTTYLPWFRTADPAQSATITVADLLHHTSGIPSNTPSENGFLGDDSPSALERGIRALDTVDLLTAPGTTFHYANTNYNILGLIVQTVSGESFVDYLSRHVFQPAGMRGASVGPNHGADAAVGFYPWFGQFRPTSVPEPAAMMPSAIMYATAADLARVLIMNMNDGEVAGTRVLSAAATAHLHRPAIASDDYQAYAMGWFVRPGWEFTTPTALTSAPRLPLVIEHDGTWSTTRTYLGFLPEQKLGFAVLINGNQPPTASELQAISSSVWRIIAGRPPTEYGASEPLLQQYGWQVAAGIVVALLVSLSWSIGLVRRPRQSARAPRRRIAILTAMLAFDLGVLALIWLYLPAAFDTTTIALVRANPDIGILVVVATVLAIGWGLTRTILAVRTSRNRSRRAPRLNAPVGKR